MSPDELASLVNRSVREWAELDEPSTELVESVGKLSHADQLSVACGIMDVLGASLAAVSRQRDELQELNKDLCVELVKSIRAKRSTNAKRSTKRARSSRRATAMTSSRLRGCMS